MYVSNSIQSLVPYKPGKSIEETQRELGISEVYKLASNENPLGPSPMAIEAMKKALDEIHRYPDSAQYRLCSVLGEKYGVKVDQIAIGNGSNELLDLIIRVFAEPGGSIITCLSSFIAYKICAQAARVKTIEIPLKDDLSFNLAGIRAYIENPSNETPRLVFIANPNNPTGSYTGTEELHVFLEAMKGRDDILIVLDEAYCEFVRADDYPDGIELQKKYSNLVVVRTLSKVYGLAGIRIGWMSASEEVIDFVQRVRNPFNVNSLAQEAAIAALSDHDFLQRSQEVNWSGLDFFYKELNRLGLPYWESQGNFVLFDVGQDSSFIYEALLKKGVIMRPVKGYGLKTHLRLSVGLQPENERAIRSLSEVLSEE